MPVRSGYTSRSHPVRRVWESAGFKVTYLLLEQEYLFLLLKEHGQDHHVKRSLTSEIRSSCRVLPGCGKQQIQGLLVLRSKCTAIPAPRFDFLPDQLRKGREGTAHWLHRLQDGAGDLPLFRRSRRLLVQHQHALSLL